MTKLNCLADICLIPVRPQYTCTIANKQTNQKAQIGTPTASVSEYVTAVVDVIRKSGLHYVLHSAGTTIEGPWDEVTAVIGKAHEAVHAMGVVRIQSDIRIGTR